VGEVTDTLNYNWDYAYVNEFPVAVEEIDVDKRRTIVQEAIGQYGRRETELRLEGFL